MPEKQSRMRMSPASPFVLFLGATVGWRVQAATTIVNDLHSVSIEADDGTFTVAINTGGKTVLTADNWLGSGGAAKKIQFADKICGDGCGLVITHTSESQKVVTPCPRFLSVIFRSTLNNIEAGALVPPIPPLLSVHLDATNTTIVENGWHGFEFGRSVSDNKRRLSARSSEQQFVVHSNALAACASPSPARSCWVNTGFLLPTDQSNGENQC